MGFLIGWKADNSGRTQGDATERSRKSVCNGNMFCLSVCLSVCRLSVSLSRPRKVIKEVIVWMLCRFRQGLWYCTKAISPTKTQCSKPPHVHVDANRAFTGHEVGTDDTYQSIHPTRDHPCWIGKTHHDGGRNIPDIEPHRFEHATSKN